MTEVTIRTPVDADHERWTELYRGYRAFYELAADDAIVERVWSWLRDPAHDVNALLAELDGQVVGLAHHRRFARPSSGTVGLYLDDLFVDPDVRGQGVAARLLDALADHAAREGLSVVRWITAQDNATARRTYDRVATATPWVTYDLAPRTSE